jgi:hypothetical protein
VSRPAAGGGRWVTVAPERLEHWLQSFAGRHGAVSCASSADEVRVTAADGSDAVCAVPFPPLHVDEGAPFGGLVAHACVERTVGVLLVRLGGFAVGVFEGSRLVTSKVGSRPVHGRAAAGGWSQHRFARRREGQAQVALEAAADVAARILVPAIDRLDAVVAGGDRRAVDAVLADPRLEPLQSLPIAGLLDVPTPDRSVLESAPARYRAVSIRVVD